MNHVLAFTRISAKRPQFSYGTRNVRHKKVLQIFGNVQIKCGKLVLSPKYVTRSQSCSKIHLRGSFIQIVWYMFLANYQYFTSHYELNANHMNVSSVEREHSKIKSRSMTSISLTVFKGRDLLFCWCNFNWFNLIIAGTLSYHLRVREVNKQIEYLFQNNNKPLTDRLTKSDSQSIDFSYQPSNFHRHFDF